MKALILAAGFGTRLMPYTEKTPKACMPFFNLPQILYNCELLKQTGVTDVIINTHHLADEVVNTINHYASLSGLTFSFSHEPQLLNSGGGIKKTESFFNSEDHFIVINADTMLLPTDITILKKMVSFHDANNALATMGTVPMSESLPNAKATDSAFKHRALWIKNNILSDINKEKAGEDTTPEHFTGCYVFSNKIFDLLPDENEFHIFDGLIYDLIKAKKVYSYFLNDTYWFETGNKKDFIGAHEEIIKLLNVNSANTVLLKSTWKRYQLKDAELPNYDWVQASLSRTFN